MRTVESSVSSKQELKNLKVGQINLFSLLMILVLQMYDY